MPIFDDEETGTKVVRLGIGDVGVLTLDSAERKKSFGVGFRQANNNHEIGETDASVVGKAPEDVGELVRLEFTDVRSIDVVIKHLEEVKTNYEW